MKFVIIHPKGRTVVTVDKPSLHAAQAEAGLGNVDHGSIGRGIGYVVDEFGLYRPVDQQHYFGCAGRLIAGASVFYGVDEAGETIDLMKSQIPDVRFYLGANDVEAAIERGEIERPQVVINRSILWRWPQPAPKGFMR
jgi:hypothetical protein